MAALEIQPQQVFPLVNADDPRALPRLDPIPWAHEAQDIAHPVARRAALLFPRQVLAYHDPCLDALPLHAPCLDQRFPDAAVEVLSFGVAGRDHDAAAAVRDEITRDRLVPEVGVRDLHDTARLLEKLNRLPSAAGFGSGQDRLEEPGVALPADRVKALGRDPRAVDKKGEGRARLHGAVLLPVTHERDLGAYFLGPFEQLPCLAARQQPGFVEDPELRLSPARRGLLEARGHRDAIDAALP
jgi:hypothetical protein